MSAPQVLIVGGGMITHDQILPAVFAMQRRGEVGEVWVCAQHGRTVRNLAAAPAIVKAFPGQSFRAFPDPSCTPRAAPTSFPLTVSYRLSAAFSRQVNRISFRLRGPTI